MHMYKCNVGDIFMCVQCRAVMPYLTHYRYVITSSKRRSVTEYCCTYIIPSRLLLKLQVD